MTPMSDGRLREYKEHATFCSGCRRCHGCIDDLSNEVHRLRTMPPDVAAAMERYAAHNQQGVMRSPLEKVCASPYYVRSVVCDMWEHDTLKMYGDLHTIATHFTALFHPTPKVQP